MGWVVPAPPAQSVLGVVMERIAEYERTHTSPPKTIDLTRAEYRELRMVEGMRMGVFDVSPATVCGVEITVEGRPVGGKNKSSTGEVACVYCKTLYKAKSGKCPTCGAPRKAS